MIQANPMMMLLLGSFMKSSESRAELNEILRVKPSVDTDNEYVRLFLANSDDPILPNTEEIQWGSFFSFDEVTQMMDKNPGDFVPAFRFLWKEFVERSL